MAPRSRTATSKATAPEAVDDRLDDELPPVRQLASVDLDLDAEIAEDEDAPPFTFRLGGQDWSVARPGVAQTLDAEQAPYLSDFFETVMGTELWEEFEPVFREVRNPDATWKLARGMSRAFGMDPTSMQEVLDADDKAHQGNRAQRRGGRRPQPRRK